MVGLLAFLLFSANAVPARSDKSCGQYFDKCDECILRGCLFCEASSVPWKHPTRLSDAQLAEQQSNLDYACIRESCQTLMLRRPGTVHFRILMRDECGDVVGAPVTTTTTSGSLTESQKAISEDSEEEEKPKWPQSWGPWHWAFICSPVAVLLSIPLGFYIRCRIRERRIKKVRIAPDCETVESNRESKFQSSTWDFTDAGPLNPLQISAAVKSIAEAEAADKAAFRPVVARCMVVSTANALGKTHFQCILEMLQKHPMTSVRFGTDWRYAGDADLVALTSLLARCDQCCLRNLGDACATVELLQLPSRASCDVIGNLTEVLSVAGHAVETVSLENPPSFAPMSMSTPPIAVALGPLRLTCRDLNLTRHKIGDQGCACVCGFIRSWSSRLLSIRLIDCGIHDAGATELSRLLLGPPEVANCRSVAAAACSLRELILSSNFIGDRGAEQIAKPLPRLDALERLYLDRNVIGSLGAASIARSLPRSNIRELVFGSHVGGNLLGLAGAEALANALDDKMERAAANRATRLEILNLEGCQISPAGRDLLAAKLPESAITQFVA